MKHKQIKRWGFILLLGIALTFMIIPSNNPLAYVSVTGMEGIGSPSYTI